MLQTMVSLSVHLVTFHLAMPFVGPVPFTCSSAVCKLLRRPITFRSQFGTILIDGRLASDASPTICLVNPTSTQISCFCVANDDDGVRSRRRTVVSVLRASYHVLCASFVFVRSLSSHRQATVMEMRTDAFGGTWKTP